jgi:mandelamide amidase
MSDLYSDFTITGLTSRLREGEITAQALATEVIERCERHSDLRALISQDPEALLRSARQADQRRADGAELGPLHGVPLLIKDNIDTRDLPTSGGTPALENDVPQHNAPSLQRLLDAGALVAAKGNLYELAVGGTSDNLHFGRVKNPYRPAFNAGGSSSGPAAAVAARMAPAGLGTDTNGSVRVPCSQCGIAGFRPSFQRYPFGGVFPSAPTRDSVGPMATTIDDLALLDAILSGTENQLPKISLSGMRLGLSSPYSEEVLDERTAAVMKDAVSLLRDLGAVIVEADIPGLTAMTHRVAWPITSYEVAVEFPRYLAHRGTTVTIDEIINNIASEVVKERFSPRFYDQTGQRAKYEDAMKSLRPALQAAIQAYYDEHQVVAMVFPTSPFPATRLQGENPDMEINGKHVPEGFGHIIDHTVHQSAAGVPSLTLPGGLTSDGLPVGISFDGPLGTDRTLLAIARAFEAARGPFPPPPGFG